MFSKKDLAQIAGKGISPDNIDKQLSFFKSGFPYLNVISAATPQSGITILDEKKRATALKEYEKCRKLKLSKFVPASGAASRMFKDLYSALDSLKKGEILSDGSYGKMFTDHIQNFAFYSDKLFKWKKPEEIIENTLTSSGLNYGEKPKGEILFHRYHEEGYSRTAFEEHLVEGALYAKRHDGYAHIIFSVSPEHLDGFKELFLSVKDNYENKYNVKLDVSFTLQSPATDTIAVDSNNEPFRKDDGSLLFRPGGHGVLIENLNECDADILIIKNIDNVIHESRIEQTVLWKKIVTGRLLESREKTFSLLKMLSKQYGIGCEKKSKAKNGVKDTFLLNKIINYLQKEYCISLPEEKIEMPEADLACFLFNKLNRPIRVCGMVRNLGEPGGGPFIVKGNDGCSSLQILEAAQLDPNNPNTASLFASGTHFNPVDMICSLTDYVGNKFDLRKYVDEKAGFISSKSYEGRNLKAQELPGLWNGAMSEWNTLFVDVPLITFNPVKTVFDLLRKEHQA